MRANQNKEKLNVGTHKKVLKMSKSTSASMAKKNPEKSNRTNGTQVDSKNLLIVTVVNDEHRPYR